MERGSLIVKIQHQAGVDAANTVNVKHCELIDFNALPGSAFNHENIPQNKIGLNVRSVTGLNNAGRNLGFLDHARAGKNQRAKL